MTPTDGDIARMVHYVLHEQFRVGLRRHNGTPIPEVVLLADCCVLLGGPSPDAMAAAERGEPLAAYCPELNGTYDDFG